MSDNSTAARRPLVSVVVVSFNARADLPDCMASLARQTYPNYEVLLVDNGSVDGGPEYVEAAFPGVRVLRTGSNLGYVGANLIGFAQAQGDHLVVLNPDTEVEPGWLEALVDTLLAHPEAGMVTSRACYFNQRDRINACGNDVHIVGLGFCRGLDEPRECYDAPARVAAISGCSFITTRRFLEDVGGFDKDLFMYVEDTDLSLRANLAGYQVRYAPASVVYHKYLLKMRPRKFYFLERNRLVLLLKNLRWRTLAALLPGLALAEAMTWADALRRGGDYPRAKLRAYGWFLHNWGRVMERRAQVQRLRRVGDRQILRLLTPDLPLDQVLGRNLASRVLGGFANWVFRRVHRAAIFVAP